MDVLKRVPKLANAVWDLIWMRTCVRVYLKRVKLRFSHQKQRICHRRGGGAISSDVTSNPETTHAILTISR